jgi:FlaA1/EpsC-like NDP-sugar epimerase
MSGLFGLLSELTRYQRRALLAICDLVLLQFALWLAMTLRWGFIYVPPTWTVFLLLAAVPCLGVGVFFFLGLYRHVTRHFDAVGDQLIFVGVSFSALGLGLGAFLTAVEGIPRSVLFLYPLLAALLVSGSRRAIRHLVTRAGIAVPRSASPTAIRSVVIYGAGQAGHALLAAIRRTRDMEVVGFVDPDPTLRRQYVSGIRVHPPEHLARIVQSRNASQVLLATEGATRGERLRILSLLEGSAVDVRVLPPVEEIASGRVAVSELRRVEAADLLGRPQIPADPDLMARTIEARSVMVTGAGGSIGSELVRQILKFDPRRLLLLDASETHLYEIETEANALLERRTGQGSRPDVVSVLGSVLDERLVRRLVRSHAVETVYHAAAFKHVPIVERNAVVGVLNNTIGTETVVNAAADCGVKRFVLVSTDKAVRPASIMGASKRVAEMLVRARAAEGGPATFSIVRFGNVLDSSGSVVPRFRRQIEAGGPVTVTHPDAARYFICIPEAAALVIQAGAMAQGGEVFALDMGEPVRILDLAKLMINLSGLKLRDQTNPTGDIEIVFTGLRPGEKLVEDLYQSERVEATDHPRIMRIREQPLPAAEFQSRLGDLKAALQADDLDAVKRALRALLMDYRPEEGRL